MYPNDNCARGSINLRRLENVGDPSRPYLVLYRDEEPFSPLNAQPREPTTSADNGYRHTEDRYKSGSAKRVLTKGDGRRAATSSTHEELHEFLSPAEEKLDEKGEIILEQKETPSAKKKETKCRPKLLVRRQVDNDQSDEEEDDYYRGDTMCAWCDDGGNLVMCDGPCMRAFHMDPECNPLEVPEDLKAAIVNSKMPFECPNCWSGTHKCFRCDREYKLDVTSDDPVLTKCDFADCGKCYCVKCQKSIAKEQELNFQISVGAKHAFICPLHWCGNCGTREDSVKDVLFPCRRCPKALHFNCMSTRVRTDPTRIWKASLNPDGTLSPYSQVSENFFYCSKHKTQNMMQGPVHGEPLVSKRLWKKWRTAYALKFRSLPSSAKFLPERMRYGLQGDLSLALFKLGQGSPDGKVDVLEIAKRKRMRNRQFADEDEVTHEANQVLKRGQQRTEKCNEMMNVLIEDTGKDLQMIDVEGKLRSVHPYNRRNCVKITEDRILLFVHAVEKAKADPTLELDDIPKRAVTQMYRALKKMKITMAPFVQKRYTSYGRHFTKTQILREVANVAISHISPGDMVVDISCGPNEFIGIISDFCKDNNLEVRVKAFDLFTPYRMDGFVKKSWFDVTQDELDEGNKLIIGLNPPFGVDCKTANQFFLHAAKFRPKILLTISPPEAIIPDEYDVIHEDGELCKDKSDPFSCLYVTEMWV